MHDVDEPLDHLAALSAEQDAVLALLDGADLDAPVPRCAPWRVRELLAHLAEVHRWAAATSRLGPHDAELPEQEPPAAADPVAGYAAAARELRAALAGDPARACRTLDGAGTVAWWRRRQLHETLVHRWDVQDALGLPRTADRAVARDCVAEVVDTLHPRQVRLGRIPPARAGVELRDPDGTRVLGDARRVVAAVAGPADALAQLLWRRTGPDDARLTVTGDRAAALALLGAALTP